MNVEGELNKGRGPQGTNRSSASLAAGEESCQTEKCDGQDYSAVSQSVLPGSETAASVPSGGGGGSRGAGNSRDRLRWLRRSLTLLVVLVALACGWQVLPERVVRLHGFTADQHARSAEAAPLPNRGERWIVDMERMALAWLAPGDRVAVWSPQGADRIPTTQFDRMRLGYLMAPEPLWRSEDSDPAEVDWVYSSRSVSLAMEQAGWTGFEPVETPRAHRLYRRIGGRADGREALTEAESGLPDGGPPLGRQVAGTVAAMAAAWVAGWLLLMAWTGAGKGRALVGWQQPFVALLIGQLAVAVGMLVVNAAGLAGNGIAAIGLVLLTVVLLALAGWGRARLRGGWSGSHEPGLTAPHDANGGRRVCDDAAGRGGSIGRTEGWLLLGWAAMLLVFGSWAAVSWHTNCLPGMGIWAHKAKLFHLSGGFPEGYFSAPGWSASQPGYPLLPALLMQWGYAWTGAVADRAVGLWNALWLAVACAWVMTWLRAARAPVAVVWLVVPLLFLSGEMVRHWFDRYAEPLFILQAVVGLGLVAGAVATLRRDGGAGPVGNGGNPAADGADRMPGPATQAAATEPAAEYAKGRANANANADANARARARATVALGMTLVATSAWIKHEGLLLTAAAGALLVPVLCSRQGVVGAAVPTRSRLTTWRWHPPPRRFLRWSVAVVGWVLLAASWLLTSRWLGAQAGGYDWARPLEVPWEETRHRLGAAWQGWRYFALTDGAQRAGLWWLAPLLMAWSLAARGCRRAADPEPGQDHNNTVRLRQPAAAIDPSPMGIHWLTLVACAYALGLGCVYVFSTQAFPWVLTASQSRGLMLPTIVLGMSLLAGLASAGGRNRRFTFAPAATDPKGGDGTTTRHEKTQP